MKKLFVLALLVIGTSLLAQEKMENEINTPRKGHWQNGERDEIRLKKLTSELNLNAKQQEQIKTVMAEQKAKRDAFMKEKMVNKDLPKASTPEERKERRQKAEEAKKAMEAKLKTILTPEQFTKWTAIKEERKEEFKEKSKEDKK